MSKFGLQLAGLAVLGLGIRLVYALAVAPDQLQPGDPQLYRDLANELAHGRGYRLAQTVPGAYPTASHPPLYPLFLAVFTKLGLASFTLHRAASCLLGATTVVLVGLLGRRLGGPQVGLVAAGLAAFYPQLFMIDGTLVAESLYAPLVVLTVILVYRLLDRPSVANGAALGAAIGLATLTRSDGILLLLVLALPLAWRCGRARWRVIAVISLATMLVLTPWLVRNQVRFDRFPLLSSNGALTQGATNCRETYYDNRYIGFVFHECALRSSCLKIRDEIPQSECFGREARAFVEDNLGQVPLVMLARVGRLWNLHAREADLAYGQLWARERATSIVGMSMFALLCVLGAFGAIVLHRRRVPLLPLLTTLVVATLTAMLAFGFSRYRLAAEPTLVVLAAVGLHAVAVAGRQALESGDSVTSSADVAAH